MSLDNINIILDDLLIFLFSEVHTLNICKTNCTVLEFAHNNWVVLMSTRLTLVTPTSKDHPRMLSKLRYFYQVKQWKIKFSNSIYLKKSWANNIRYRLAAIETVVYATWAINKKYSCAVVTVAASMLRQLRVLELGCNPGPWIYLFSYCEIDNAWQR